MDLMQWRDEVLWLAKKIIFHDPTKNYFYKGDPEKKSLIPKHKSLFYAEGSGVPIGNLTSQFFANVYLNELDQFVTKTLGIERYVRYVDDFVIVGEDINRLKSYIMPIDLFLKEKLSLKIHRGKIQLQETKKGIDFLGYFVKVTHTLVRQKVVRRCKDRIRKIESIMDDFSEEKRKETAEGILPMVNSYYGHFHHANSFSLRKHLHNSHMEKTNKFLKADEGYGSLRLKKD